MQTLTQLQSQIVLRLFEIGSIRLDGPFTLKSGLRSPFYIDLRLLVSDPELLRTVGAVLNQLLDANGVQYDHLLGVPYTALPMATSVAVQFGKKMLMRRKERKSYGTKKEIEGIFEPGDTVCVVEDLVTSGMSVFETIEPLKAEGLEVSDVVVLLDRQQGGRINIEGRGLKLHAVLTMDMVCQVLLDNKRIDAQKVSEIKAFISQNQVSLSKPSPKETPLTFQARSGLAKHKLASKLFSIMEKKKSNLCVSVDVETKAELLRIVSAVAPHICLIKTHIDILKDFDTDVVTQLTQLASQFGFLIFEDRKFADIGNTVSLQYASGPFGIIQWADITNAHLLPGPGILDGLYKPVTGLQLEDSRGLLLLAEMSSKGNLITAEYTKKCVDAAESHPFVMGFICQNASTLKKNPGLVYLTPGVQIGSSKDSLGQQYRTPRTAIVEEQCDIVIVGRGVYQSDDPAASAKVYQEIAWKAYEELYQ